MGKKAKIIAEDSDTEEKQTIKRKSLQSLEKKKKQKSKKREEEEEESLSEEESEQIKNKKSSKQSKTTTPSKKSKTAVSKKSKSKGNKKSKSNKKAKTKSQKKEDNDDEEDNQNMEEEFEDLLLPGQRHPTPPMGDASRAFYESLLEQKQNSIMALKWCIDYGCLDQEKAAKGLEKLESLKKKSKNIKAK